MCCLWFEGRYILSHCQLSHETCSFIYDIIRVLNKFAVSRISCHIVHESVLLNEIYACIICKYF